MPEKPAPPKTDADIKAERLAQALRDNLKKRKAQARGREAEDKERG
ncbi:hypothetical protein [Zavarzinia compransoris]|nr:hypothetical protein [Zavarzinia compransoris]TDP43853.1 hypothetical protein DES42_109109 [Zavarzinia compransoris]